MTQGTRRDRRGGRFQHAAERRQLLRRINVLVERMECRVLLSTSTPFLGQAFNIVSDTIEAENFDNGGEGVAYHDTTPQNVNGKYRPTEGVDINAGGSNGFSVGYTAPGEWMNYSINAPVQGNYALQARVANYKAGGTFHVEVDGTNVTGALTVPDSGPWDTWTTITSKSFAVSAGDHTMRVVMDTGGYWGNVGDFDSFKFVSAAGPFKGSPFNINKDKIEAEDFDNGGEGVAYHDTTPGNQTGLYRPAESVDINKGGSNDYSVGYTAPGEWLTYSITTPAAGSYTLQATVADLKPGGTFHVEIDGKNVTGTLTVPDTSGWFNWQTVTSPVFNVSAGDQTMKVVLDTGGYWGNVGNFESFKFVTHTPFSDHPYVVGVETIEAENFDNGGEGIAFHDTTPQNLGGKYRTTAVDINAGGSNGFDVGYTAPGEWLAYSVNSPVGGGFVIQASVASLQPGGKFHVEIDGKNVTGAMAVSDTTGWFKFQTVVSPQFAVSPGDHVMRVVMDSAGALGAVGNFDYFRFAPAGIVTLVSQDRSVMTASFERTPPEETRQTGAGNFGPFDQSLSFQSTVAPNSGVNVHQTSVLSVNATGAQFIASGDAFAYGTSGAGGDSLFKVEFDVPTAVAYKITFAQAHNPKYPAAAANLEGPLTLQIIGFENMTNTYNGTLEPGRYVLTTGASGGQQYDLKVYLGSAITGP